MPESILVIGPTGNVGSQLIQQFAAAGRRVRALVRNPEKVAAVREFADPVMGDLSKPATLAAAFEGIERVLVLAPLELVSLCGNAFDAAAAAGVKHVVYQSGLGTTELDDSHFRDHEANEKRAASLGAEWTILRPTRFMNYMPFVWPSVLKRNLILESAGEGTMTVIDPADVAAAAFVTLTESGHAGQIYRLTSEDALSASDLQRILSRALGRELSLFHGDTESLRVALIECGAPEVYAPIMANYFASVRAGFWRPTDTFTRLVGRKPRSYAEWLERHLASIVRSVGT